MACGSCHGGHRVTVTLYVLVTGIASLPPMSSKFTASAADLHTSSVPQVIVMLISCPFFHTVCVVLYQSVDFGWR